MTPFFSSETPAALMKKSAGSDAQMPFATASSVRFGSYADSTVPTKQGPGGTIAECSVRTVAESAMRRQARRKNDYLGSSCLFG